jgi:hypothetical protein
MCMSSHYVADVFQSLRPVGVRFANITEAEVRPYVYM